MGSSKFPICWTIRQWIHQGHFSFAFEECGLTSWYMTPTVNLLPHVELSQHDYYQWEIRDDDMDNNSSRTPKILFFLDVSRTQTV